MIRIANWDLELFKWAAMQLNQPVVWGKNDCSSLCRDGLIVMYGFDFTKDVKWYRSANGAIRTHIMTGGIIPLLKGQGATEIPPLLATTGDIMVVPQREGDIADNASMILGREFLNSGPPVTELDVVTLRHLDEMVEDYIILRLPNG